jgi:hypothetical protein
MNLRELPRMPRFAMLVALGLTACGYFDSSPGDLGSGEMKGWRLVSGKAPSRAEYAAMVAACQDGAVQRAAAATLDNCLADLGLKRAE